MTPSELRRGIDAIKRKFARELAIIKLRRIAEAVADDWIPSDPRNRPTSSSASPGPAFACPPSPASAAAWTMPDAKAKSLTPNPSCSVSSLGPRATATANPFAGNSPSLPRDHNHFPNWVRVRTVPVQC